MQRYWEIIAAQPRPIRFLVSRLLMRTGACRWLRVRRQGYWLRFFPSSVSATLWIDPTALQDEEQFLRSYLRPGDVVIDVGANVGTTTLAAAAIVGERGHVVAIEPHPRIFGYLSANVALNAANNVQLHNTALGEQPGTVRFTDERADDFNGVTTAADAMTLPIRRLDDLLGEPPAISLLKIDVEGFELFVLRGSTRTLAATDCVFFESNAEHFARRQYACGDVLRLLMAHGFRVYRRDGAAAVAEVGPDYASHRNENLVAVRRPEAFLQRTGWRLTPASGGPPP
jgi:FkbM family methyltransferase